MEFQGKYLITLKRHDLLSDRIYQVYTSYIPGIYNAYTMLRSLASPLSCPSALGSLRQGLLLDLLSFGHIEAIVIGYSFDIINIYMSYQHILYGISNNFRKLILFISMNISNIFTQCIQSI